MQPNGNAPQLLTRTRARTAKAARDAPHLFHLTHTGGDARVRYPVLTDYATIGRLPGHLQQRVLAALDEAQAAAGEVMPGENGTAPRAPGQLLGLMQMDDQVARLYCLVGFVEPELVESEDALDPGREDQVLVDDIDPRDRQRFMRVCAGLTKAEADELAPFLRGPADGLAAGGPGGDGGAAPERPAGAAEAVQPDGLPGLRPGVPGNEAVG